MHKNPVIDEVGLLLKKAKSELEQAELLKKEGHYDGAVNRYYYSMFHLAQALLLEFGERPTSHSGLIQRFSLLAIYQEVFPKKFAQALADIFRERENSDHTSLNLIEEDHMLEIQKKARKFHLEIAHNLEIMLEKFERGTKD